MIGIHYGFSNQLNYNLGTFIKSIIKELNKYKNITKNNENNMSNNDTINKPNIISLENNTNKIMNNFDSNNNKLLNSNNNKTDKNNNNIYQNNKNNNMLNNIDNKIIDIGNNNMIEILSKDDFSLSIKSYPSENNFINIFFDKENGHRTNIIIPSYKGINQEN